MFVRLLGARNWEGRRKAAQPGAQGFAGGFKWLASRLVLPAASGIRKY